MGWLKVASVIYTVGKFAWTNRAQIADFEKKVVGAVKDIHEALNKDESKVAPASSSGPATN